MSVMNGFRAELVGRILGLNGHVAVYSKQAGGIADFDQLALKITDMPDVIAVTPQIEGQVMATQNRVSIGAVVRGVRWSDLAVRKPLWDSLDEGDINRFRDENGVLIGREMAFKLGVKAGDSVTLTTAKGKGHGLLARCQQGANSKLPACFMLACMNMIPALCLCHLICQRPFLAMKKAYLVLKSMCQPQNRLQRFVNRLHKLSGLICGFLTGSTEIAVF
jgi:hypothetical protein